MLNIFMRYGIEKDFFTTNELDNWKQKFQLNSITNTKQGDPCWGIDSKSLTYPWLKKVIMPVFSKHFNTDLKLVFASYIDCTKIFRIHNDIKPLPEGATGKHFVSILVPYAIDQKKENFQQVATEFYTDEKKITDAIAWEENSFIWFESQIFHNSSNFKDKGIDSKQYFVFHTYV